MTTRLLALPAAVVLALTLAVPAANAAPAKDSDKDGWSNAKERRKGTNPYHADTDGDGFLDSTDKNPRNFKVPGPTATRTVKFHCWRSRASQEDPDARFAVDVKITPKFYVNGKGHSVRLAMAPVSNKHFFTDNVFFGVRVYHEAATTIKYVNKRGGARAVYADKTNIYRYNLFPKNHHSGSTIHLPDVMSGIDVKRVKNNKAAQIILEGFTYSSEGLYVSCTTDSRTDGVITATYAKAVKNIKAKDPRTLVKETPTAEPYDGVFTTPGGNCADQFTKTNHPANIAGKGGRLVKKADGSYALAYDEITLKGIPSAPWLNTKNSHGIVSLSMMAHYSIGAYEYETNILRGRVLTQRPDGTIVVTNPVFNLSSDKITDETMIPTPDIRFVTGNKPKFMDPTAPHANFWCNSDAWHQNPERANPDDLGVVMYDENGVPTYLAKNPHRD